MSTDCVGIDTSKFEFTFDCESAPGERLRHSFGVGGFDEQEEFDTSIKCSKCIAPEIVSAHKEVKPPHPVPVAGSITAASQASMAKSASQAGRMDSRGTVEEETPMHVHFLASAADAKKEEKSATVVTYGPEDCVSTWRDGKTGHCQVKTNCTGIDTTQTMFGLICENDDGKTRHLFGKDSFDSEETFDTLIPCKTCLALDNVTKATELEAENVELATEVNALATEVGAIKETYQGIEKDVSKLNTAVAEKEGGGKKEEKSAEKKDGEEKKDEEKKDEEKKEEKKEEGEDKKEGEKKDEEKKEDGEAAKTEFYLTDRDVDENLPYDTINAHLKGSASHVKKQRNGGQKKRVQRRQKSHHAESEDDDVDDDAEDEETPSPSNFRRASQKRTEKEDTSDDSDDSSDDQSDD